MNREEREYLSPNGKCLQKLLEAQSEYGGFIAAPGYRPYGNYVWHRDSAECIITLDDYAKYLGKSELYSRTEKALIWHFKTIEQKADKIEKLRRIERKVKRSENDMIDPTFYSDAYHPHCRLKENGEEIGVAWNNRQYDSIARLLVALSKHLQHTQNYSLLKKCEKGIRACVHYLFDAIWDNRGEKWLTPCANEWEELDEPHLRGPLFSFGYWNNKLCYKIFANLYPTLSGGERN